MGITERREKEKKEMRGLILETAMKLFLEEGFENVSLRRIADKIEYSPATIYLYFKDKDEILYALHNEGFEKLYALQQTTLDIKDPLKRLWKQGELYINFGLENPEYYNLMFIMRSPAKKICEENQWETGLRSYGFLKDNVSECMEAGLMPMAEVEIATFSFWAHVHGVVSLIIRERCVIIPEEFLPHIIKGSFDFMMEVFKKK
ncbi:MAG: TetR/AcrR family transcriptional regulator [Nitrospirae bacterium]|nr:MAG: TetR/AcrR family transcriptional regulator [Nitrospirota bacterium]